MPSKAELRQRWNEVGDEKVVLHILQRPKTRTNGSPFCIKMETYLRMAGIEYEVDHTQPSSSKGKTPWLTFRKEDVADSQFCVELLAEKLDKNLDKNMSDEQKAVSRAVRLMLEDHYYWCYVTLEFAHNKAKNLKAISPPFPAPSFLQGFIWNKIVGTISKQAQAQGIGRHSKEEVLKLAKQDLKALSDFLKEKPFLMGDNPTTLDCTAFGMLSQLYASHDEDDSELIKYAVEECGNLKDYFDRIKEKYYSDWDDLLWKPEEKPKKKGKEGQDEEKDKDNKEGQDEEDNKDKEKEGKDEEKKEE